MRKLLLVPILWLLMPLQAAPAHEITIETEAARAVLAAVADPGLSEAEARRIARLPANAAVLRKVKGYDPNGTEDRFVEELLATARGENLRGASLFRFERTLRDRPGTLNTLAAIEADPAAFVKWVNERVDGFSPPGLSLPLRGHLIAAGSPTGFALGGNDFYLNITHFPDDLEAAKVVTAHELYHSVQNAAYAALGRKPAAFDAARYAKLASEPERHAYVVDAFLANLITEGIAMYVGDPELLAQSKGGYSKWDLGRLRTMQERMDRLPIIVDMALVSLTSPDPIPYEDAYALGFYGDDQPLYFVGYEMAKTIAHAKGPRRLGELLTGSGCAFAQDYLAVVEPGKSVLRAPTRAMIARHCGPGGLVGAAEAG